VVSFTPPDALPTRKELPVWIRRLNGGPQNKYGRCKEEEISFSVPGIEPRSLDLPARNLPTISTELTNVGPVVNISSVRSLSIRKFFALYYGKCDSQLKIQCEIYIPV
jgi:hypothetical protein